MESVMDMAQGFFGGDMLSRVSSWLHESPAGTKAAMQDALPVSLLGLANQAQSEEGSRALLGRFQRGDYPHLEADELGRAVSDPETTDRLVQSNRGFTEGMFGGKLGPIVDGMAEHAGVSKGAISKVLALATPVVLGMIGKRAVAQNLDAGGLRSYLGEQQKMAARVLPASLTRLIVPGGAAAAATSAPGDRRAPAVVGPLDRPRAFPWWLVGLLAAIAVIVFAWGRRSHHPVPRTQVVAEHTVSAPLTAGHVAALSRFLDGNAAPPMRFVLQDLRFETDSPDIDPGTQRVLDDVAGVLSSHPTARILLEGHTDSTGAPDANRALSLARAESTRKYLVDHGIDASRIETAGFGASRPLASNDTADGRAMNRRTELVVTAR
ncbi:MAG TPA: OmpA family protein [Polyangia bacterium]|nr:OmpA family protein [Polyangia bacterium]